ncbi:MAG: archemetzincin [Thermoplasmata archaeon]
MRIALLPLGAISEETVGQLGADLREAGVGVTVRPPRGVPAEAYASARDQYLASDLLALARGSRGEHVLVVTEVDLYVEPLSFVFGQADVGGQAAVISLRRLASPESRIFRRRAVTEALHELGHNAGLDHCRKPACVMYFSNRLVDTDRKGPNPCGVCSARLGDDAGWHSPA